MPNPFVIRVAGRRRTAGEACLLASLPLAGLSGSHEASAASRSADRIRIGFLWMLALGFLTATCGGRLVEAANESPQAGTAPSEPAAAQADAAAPAFKPEDISIGEPISLPFAPPLTSAAPDRPPGPPAVPPAAPLPTSATQLPSVVVPAVPGGIVPVAPVGSLPPRQSPMQAPFAPAADHGTTPEPVGVGTGWLGIAVDDALVPGRLVVVEVAPEGPAAKAGVRSQDMLLAIDGKHLQTSDELAAAFAAIAPGQRVRMAVGRDNKIEDVVAQAAARPPEAFSRDWQSAPASQTASLNVSAPAFAAAPPLVAPTQLVQDPAAVGVLPPPAPLVAAPAANPSPLAVMPPARPPATLSDRAAGDPVTGPRALNASPSSSGRTALGVRTVPVDPNVQSRFRLPEARGAFVIGVVQDLPASKAGVPPGSVIVAINHQPVRSPNDLTHLVSRGPVGTPVPLHYVLPGGESKQADVVLQSLEQPLERVLIGDGNAGPTPEPPVLQPPPQTSRRVQPTAGYGPADTTPLDRLEELLRRMNNRLEQIERRLERLEPRR